MTTGKRALIVDDSRSARVILSRMLEQHGLAADTAESAEQALEYLRENRPDVIFMDHLMPGMDGFQAVQAIKADAQTATIPLMMYTSQEGELYVSQARALGAVGVLPKTVRPVDVSRVLYQLHLLPDRRQSRSALFDATLAGSAPSAVAGAAPDAAKEAATAPLPPPPAGTTPVAPTGSSPLPAAALSELQGSLRQSMQQLVRDQLGEHRRFVLATFEAFARRMSGEFKEALAKASPPVTEPVAVEPSPVAWWPMALTALLAALPSAILGVLYWQATQRNAALAGELTESKAEVAEQAARLELPVRAVETAAEPAPGAAAAAAHSNAPSEPLAVEYVPYGETPLAAARLDRLRELATTLEAQHYRGRILVETFAGDFCLVANANEGFAPADPALPIGNCDLVGNPFDDALSPAQRQSIAFANFVASLRQRTGGAIVVEPVNAGRRGVEAYPEQGGRSTAGEWNAVASRNNRVVFRLAPAG